MAGKTLKARVLACPNCGAKLRWDRDAPIIECRYCHTHVVVDTGRPTTQPADVISAAAPRTVKIVLGVSALALVAGGISVAMVQRQARPGTSAAAPAKTSTIAELAATPIAARPDEVAKRHGVQVLGTRGATVQIRLSDGAIREAAFYWDKDRFDHVSSITLWSRTEPPDFTEVVTRARAQLGRRLRPAATGGHQFHAKGVAFSASSTVQILHGANAAPGWEDAFAAMWTVLKGAALGTDDKLDERTRRDVLNLAYPLAVLNELDFETVVDAAEREVHRVAPGADSDGERHTIGLEHPWFESAWLGWANKADGKWTGATLYFPDELDFKAQHEAIIACVAPVLGEPRKLVSDHLAGTFSLQFRAQGGRPWVDVGERTFQIYPHHGFGEPATADGFHALVTALAACGR